MLTLFRTISLAISVLIAIASSSSSQAQQQPLVYFDESESAEIFERAEIKNDFWTLSRFFVAERYLTYCGIATSVAVLNALDVPAPISPLIYPYQIFTEENIFTEEALKVKPVMKIEQDGLTLEELADLLDVFDVEIEYKHGDQVTLDDFRTRALEALRNDNERFIVNYSRKSVGQIGDGHISPVAAYDETSDRFLVLDVARYKYAPAWIAAEDLHAALLPKDSSSNESRGYVVVTKS